MGDTSVGQHGAAVASEGLPFGRDVVGPSNVQRAGREGDSLFSPRTSPSPGGAAEAPSLDRGAVGSGGGERKPRLRAKQVREAEALARSEAQVDALRLELDAARAELAEISERTGEREEKIGSAFASASGEEAQAVLNAQERTVGDSDEVSSPPEGVGPLVARDQPSLATIEAAPVPTAVVVVSPSRSERLSATGAGHIEGLYEQMRWGKVPMPNVVFDVSMPSPSSPDPASAEIAGSNAGSTQGEAVEVEVFDRTTPRLRVDEGGAETPEKRPIVVGARLGASSDGTEKRVETVAPTPVDAPAGRVSEVGSAIPIPPAASRVLEIPRTSAEFADVMRTVEEAARDWDLRADTAEGKFVSAMMAGVGWVGRVSEAAQTSFDKVAEKHRESAELELARAKEITKALTASLSQSRNAMINLQVERETVVARMLTDTMPMFAEKLKDAVVIREKAEFEGTRFKRSVVSCFIALGVFLGGYAVRAWADSAEIGALSRCLAHPLYASNRAYCEITNFAAVVPRAP